MNGWIRLFLLLVLRTIHPSPYVEKMAYCAKLRDNILHERVGHSNVAISSRDANFLWPKTTLSVLQQYYSIIASSLFASKNDAG